MSHLSFPITEFTSESIYRIDFSEAEAAAAQAVLDDLQEVLDAVENITAPE